MSHETVGSIAVFFIVGWLAAFVVLTCAANAAMRRLLSYLRENKEESFLLVMGDGRYMPFWKKPPFGFYETAEYAWSSRDNDDATIVKRKAVFRRILIMISALVVAFFVMGAVINSL